MNDEQISEIVNDIALYGNLHKDRSRHDNRAALSEIRQRIEELVAHPGVTPQWHMIADSETWMIVNIGTDAYAYCRGMDYEDAFDLVRKLNGIEE